MTLQSRLKTGWTRGYYSKSTSLTWKAENQACFIQTKFFHHNCVLDFKMVEDVGKGETTSVQCTISVLV